MTFSVQPILLANAMDGDGVRRCCVAKTFGFAFSRLYYHIFHLYLFYSLFINYFFLTYHYKYVD